MNILIVHAHPEPRSFTSALKDQAAATLTRLGHVVTVTDLHQQDFDPIPRKSDFTVLADPSHFRYNTEQAAAMARGVPTNRFAGFTPLLGAELGKLDRADLVILTAPVWWYALPAVAKGWVDKVLAQGFAYDHHHTFDKGLLAGKRILLAVTTGGPEQAYVPGGYGTFEANFFPLHHGTFWYCGMTVLEPFCAWGAGWIDEAGRAAHTEAWGRRLETLDHSTVVYPSR